MIFAESEEKVLTGKEMKFPCIMRNPNSGLIILASGIVNKDNLRGTLLDVADNEGWIIGEIHDNFNPVYFEPFYGEVTLKQHYI